MAIDKRHRRWLSHPMLRLLRALDAFPRERATFAQLHREGWIVAISTVMAAERRGLVTRGEQWLRLTDAGRAVVAAYAQGHHQAGIDRQAFRGDDMAVYVGPSVHIVEELPDTGDHAGPVLSEDARRFLARAVDTATATEPLWLADDEDPSPMLECRRAGLVTSDVYAVMPTAKGRAVARALAGVLPPKGGETQ